MQQLGPSSESDNNMLKAELNELRMDLTKAMDSMVDRLINALRPEKPVETVIKSKPLISTIHTVGDSQEGSCGYGRGPPSEVHTSFVALDEPRGSKHLSRVATMIPPGGKAWAGISERRSAKRFLLDCAQAATIAGLDAEGLTSYFVTKCVTPELAAELADFCQSEYFQRPIPYHAVNVKMEEYFTAKYALTSSNSRLSEMLESGVWAKDVKDFEQYVNQARAIMRDCECAGKALDDPYRIRILVKHLPKELKEFVELHCGDIESPEVLISKLTKRVMLHPQFGNFKGSGKPIAVKVVCAEEACETGELDSGVCGVWKGMKKECLLCKSPEHFFRECPSLDAAQAYVEKEGRNKPPQDKFQDRSGEKAENKGDFAKTEAVKRSVKWANVVLVASTNRQYEDVPMTKVKVRGVNAPQGSDVFATGLIDTGAAKSLCSQAFAESLYEKGVVLDEDIKGVQELKFQFANRDSSGDIGHVHMLIDGVPLKLHVLRNLAPELILGNSFIPFSPRIQKELFSFLQRLSGAGLETGFQSNSATVARVSEEEPGGPQHADWPLINFNWLSAKRPTSDLRQIIGRAKELEKSLVRKGVLTLYEDIVRLWNDNGWLQETPAENIKHFMNHFAVIKGGSTQMAKCRLVVNGSQLKGFLDPGTCSHRDLLSNLIAWRGAERYNVVDISSAYMRLGISEYDSLYMGLWWQGRAYRFRSLPMGICVSASELQQCVNAFIEEWYQVFTGNRNAESSSAYETRIVPYMDDLLQLLIPNVYGQGSISENDELAERKSLTDFLEGRKLFPSIEKLTGTENTSKVLGVAVGPNDTIRVDRKFETIALASTISRQEAVSILSKGFDPLGLEAELQMFARTLIQKTAGLAWKQHISKELTDMIKVWMAAANKSKVCIPRALNLGEKLFVFCDASHLGHSVIVLGRDMNGHWQRLLAKGLVYKKHQKGWTGISAKIELLALHNALQTCQYIMKVLERIGKRPRLIVGSDSETNISRLHDMGVISLISDPWQKRVAEICARGFKNLGVSIFHCPGKINPADAISRGTPSKSEEETALIYRMAVNHFCEERAFVPEVTEITRVNEQNPLVEELSLAEEPWMLSAVNAIVKRDSLTSLTARFLRERKDGQSREEWFHEYQKSDSILARSAARGLYKMQNGMWVRANRQTMEGELQVQLVVPKELIQNILFECHDQAGHLGPGKLAKKVQQCYCWHGVIRDCRKYAASCEACQSIKGNRAWLTPPATLFSDGRCWSVVSCDLVKGMEDGILLVVVDMYCRFMFTAAIPNERVGTIISALEKIFLREGPPRSIVTDNAAVFTGKEFQSFVENWDISHRLTPRYSGWYGGWYERSHATIVKTMSVVLTRTNKSWKQLLEKVTLWVNSRPYEGISDLTPFEVFKGRKLFSFVDIALPVEDVIPSDEHFEENLRSIMDEVRFIREQFEEVWVEMRSRSFGVMDKRVKRYDKLSPGDLVYTWIPKLMQKKLGSRWEGPYQVEKVLNDEVGNRVLVNGKMEHAFNLKRGLKRKEEKPVSESEPVENEPNETTPDQIERLPRILEDQSSAPNATERDMIIPQSNKKSSEVMAEERIGEILDERYGDPFEALPEENENQPSEVLFPASGPPERRGEKRKERESAKEALKKIRAALAIMSWDRPGGELLIF